MGVRAPSLGVEGAQQNNVFESLTWKAARRAMLWPLAAAVVVALGALAGMQLVQDDRPFAATLMVGAVAFLGATIANLLVSRATAAQSQALRDPLTGLPNRALLDDRIEQEASSRSTRRSGGPSIRRTRTAGKT